MSIKFKFKLVKFKFRVRTHFCFLFDNHLDSFVNIKK